MQRRRIVIIAGLLALLAALVPLIAIAVYAKHRAMLAERAHLAEYSDWTLNRAERSFGFAGKVLHQLNTENWQDCSQTHIDRMRRLTIETRSVDEIGFFIDGQLACTGWGRVDQAVDRYADKYLHEGKADIRLQDGLGLYLDVYPEAQGSTRMLAISRGNHNVLLKPERLVDVLTDTEMTLGIATADGRLLAANRKVDPALVRSIAQSDKFGHSGEHVFAVSHDGNFRAFASTDRSLVKARVTSELWSLLPVGLTISALLVGLIVWISNQRLSLERELAVRIRRREFCACYQPIMELSTGRCIGAEALLRWRRPDGSAELPDFVIPLAEAQGLIEPLTDLMIECVVTDLAQTLHRKKGLHISINISPSDMQSGRFLRVLDRALDGSGVSPAQIWLEATERGFIHARAASKTLKAARARGHLVAIDDFGTGFSSLSLLERLPLDALKIDKSFVEAIGKGAATSVVVPHIIEMAHGLDLSIVAEGVETIEQEAYLRDAGVEFAQGWLYSKALTAPEFLAFLEGKKNGGRTPPVRHPVAV